MADLTQMTQNDLKSYPAPEPLSGSKTEDKADDKIKTSRGRGRPPGSRNRRKKSDVKLPELETRKSPDEVEDTYAAMKRIEDTEQKQYEYKIALAKRHAEVHGGPVPPVPKPSHMLAAAAPDPVDTAELKGVFLSLPVAFAMVGFESQIPPALLDQWAASMAKVARHYAIEARMLDWGAALVSSAAVGGYYVAEAKAKKDGTWDELKKRREMAMIRVSGKDALKPFGPEA